MPLTRYFIFVGGALLALLFISDAYLPKLPVAHEANSGSPVIIRIHSDRKWPERVVYDTSLPTIIPAQIANTDAGVPATVSDLSAKAQAREAFAQMQPSDASQLQPSDPKKLGPKLQRKVKIAKRRAAPPMVLVARQPHFGWFGNNVW